MTRPYSFKLNFYNNFWLTKYETYKQRLEHIFANSISGDTLELTDTHSISSQAQSSLTSVNGRELCARVLCTCVVYLTSETPYNDINTYVRVRLLSIFLSSVRMVSMYFTYRRASRTASSQK